MFLQTMKDAERIAKETEHITGDNIIDSLWDLAENMEGFPVDEIRDSMEGHANNYIEFIEENYPEQMKGESDE